MGKFLVFFYQVLYIAISMPINIRIRYADYHLDKLHTLIELVLDLMLNCIEFPIFNENV